MKNKYLKFSNTKLIFFAIFFTAFVSYNFFKNIYDVIKYSHLERLIRNSHFCEKDSMGFVGYLKMNYKFEENPILINNSISPISDWIYYDFKKKNSKNKIILLNYDKNLELLTKFENNQFITSGLPPLIKKIETIKIFLNKELIRDHEININIYEILEEKKRKIYSQKKVLQKKIINELVLSNFEVTNKSKLINFSIEIENFQNDLINKVSLIISNKINLNDYEILENKQNCYLLKKHD